MKKILNHLFEHKTFNSQEAEEILISIATGKYNTAQIAAFMAAYCMRSITVDEVQGFQDAMLSMCLDPGLSDYDLIDLCGTGGDGKDTFNISTLASFVVAGAGYKVAKHGNYGVSSGCGSSNVMEYLGYKPVKDSGHLRKSIEKAGIAFLHAPLFHPAMKAVAPIRKDLGVKTFFNMLGPLVNPARPCYQSVGVYSLEIARIYAYLYQKSSKHYSILHALDGYDEISLTGPFKVFSNDGESLYHISDIGLSPIAPEAIKGGATVEESAGVFKKVLQLQSTSEQTNTVLCNAAMAIKTISPPKSFSHCFEEAKEALLSKKALKSFNTLLALV